MNKKHTQIFFAISLLLCIIGAGGVFAMEGAGTLERDEFATPVGKVQLISVGHATLALQVGNLKIHIDPQTRYTDYSKWEKADIILITHEHADHLDMKAIQMLSGPTTRLITTQAVRDKIGQGEVLQHFQTLTHGSLSISAVPAYNTTPGREMYHPKERKDNGYILSFGSFRIYVAGDTEDIPEMASLGPIDVAFLPMNQPYTMTPQQVASAARKIKPKILYPYHYSSTNPQELVPLLAQEKNIEIRIRNLP
ncbi:MBL fold metallo-hydrolase [Treponema sp. J25]|uniref:MBL fold metallo-hydrolase n=1 Tax=Treponema sp. J25 TaxID=2094121 RepID=UPI001A9ECC2D|nr:MBL fold metallo-hydrolase [Treponema sp. J25]